MISVKQLVFDNAKYRAVYHVHEATEYIVRRIVTSKIEDKIWPDVDVKVIYTILPEIESYSGHRL